MYESKTSVPKYCDFSAELDSFHCKSSSRSICSDVNPGCVIRNDLRLCRQKAANCSCATFRHGETSGSMLPDFDETAAKQSPGPSSLTSKLRDAGSRIQPPVDECWLLRLGFDGKLLTPVEDMGGINSSMRCSRDNIHACSAEDTATSHARRLFGAIE